MVVFVMVLGLAAWNSPVGMAGEHGGKDVKEHGGGEVKEHGGKSDSDWLLEAASVLKDSHPEHAAQLERIARERA